MTAIPMPDLLVTATTIKGENDDCQLDVDFSNVKDLNIVLAMVELMESARERFLPTYTQQLYYGITPEQVTVYESNEHGRFEPKFTIYWPMEWEISHLRTAIVQMQWLRNLNDEQ